MATTVKEVKLQQNGSMISPVTMIKSVKNLSGTDLQTLLDAKASSSHTHSEYASSSHNHDGSYIKKATYVVFSGNGNLPAMRIGERIVYYVGPSRTVKTPTSGNFFYIYHGNLSYTTSSGMKHTSANQEITSTSSDADKYIYIERLS